MKRMLSGVICLVLFWTLLAVPACAEIKILTVQPGETVEAEFCVEQNPSHAVEASMEIRYDSSVLELTSDSPVGNRFPLSGGLQDIAEGTSFMVRFRVREGSQAGDYPVTVVMIDGSDYNEKNVEGLRCSEVIIRIPAESDEAAAEDEPDEVVAKTAVDLFISDPEATTEDGKPIRIIRRAETNLGDLCADAYLDQSGGADIAFVNGGAIRTNLGAGDLTLNDIWSVLPFGNGMTVIEVTGRQVLDALEWSVHSLPGEFGGFYQVAGLTFEYDATIPTPCVEDENRMFDHVDGTMTRRVRNVLVAGEPLDPAKIYKLVSTDYQLLNKGDGYTIYEGCKVLRDSVKLDYLVLLDYITEALGGVVGDGYENPYGQGRMVSVGAEQ